MDVQVKAYIEKQKSPLKEICKKLHKIITKTFPGIEDELKWGVPAFNNRKYYIVALKDHVNLGFSKKGLTKKQIELFDGQTNTMVHLGKKTLKDIDEKRIVELIKIIKAYLNRINLSHSIANPFLAQSPISRTSHPR